MTTGPHEREHGGNLDAAIARFGGSRPEWLDLSTGINPEPYPVPDLPAETWTALPDRAATEALEAAARAFWSVPAGAAVLAAPGASSLIARIPALAPPGRVALAEHSYNEHRAAFVAHGWEPVAIDAHAEARVIVHPDNPTGRLWLADDGSDAGLKVIDESFCDLALGNSHVRHRALRPGTLILKSLGKFWGLAGLRLGFVIGDPELVGQLVEMLGPWPVSGPALHIGRLALEDMQWANRTRQRFTVDTARMDAALEGKGARLAGGTSLFRLYEVDDAARWQERLAEGRVWSRTFSWSPTLIRLGLPPRDRWAQLEAAL